MQCFAVQRYYHRHRAHPFDYHRSRLLQQSTALHYTLLYCTALYCSVLHCTALYSTLLYCTDCIAVNCTALYYTALYYIAVNCTSLHHTAQHCIAVHWSTLDCTTVKDIIRNSAHLCSGAFWQLGIKYSVEQSTEKRIYSEGLHSILLYSSVQYIA